MQVEDRTKTKLVRLKETPDGSVFKAENGRLYMKTRRGYVVGDCLDVIDIQSGENVAMFTAMSMVLPVEAKVVAVSQGDFL